MKYYKDEYAEEEIAKMEKIIKSRKIEESYARELVARQKGELSALSRYYEGNIAEANWSLIEDDSNIEKLDKVDWYEIICEKYSYSERIKDSEYEYIFIPSYYAVKTLILYYMKNPKQAERIYGLKNAVVRCEGKKFYGGLPFILKYMGGDFEDSRIDFAGIMNTLLDLKNILEANNENNFLNDFINDIIDCVKDSNCKCKNLILERRIKNFNEAKENWFCINFYEEIKKEKDLLLKYVNDYTILMHKDVKKDWNHLQKGQVKKAKEKISKTPKHPYNDFPEDSEPLKGDLKGWFSQRISKKDRLVYKIEADKKIVYIAAVCSHYDEAPRRSKSTDSYRLIEDY